MVQGEAEVDIDLYEDNDLYEPNQSAYRKFHSTETALLRTHNDILLAADQHLEAVLVLLNFSAAFDTLSRHAFPSGFTSTITRVIWHQRNSLEMV